MLFSIPVVADQFQMPNWTVASNGAPVPIDQQSPYEFLLSCAEDILFPATKYDDEGDSLGDDISVDDTGSISNSSYCASNNYTNTNINTDNTPPPSPFHDSPLTRHNFYNATTYDSYSPSAAAAAAQAPHPELQPQPQLQQPLMPLVVSIKRYTTKKVTGGAQKHCFNCLTSDTPVWRKDEMENPICNACGIFLKLHGYARPSSFPFRKAVVQKRPGRKCGRSRLMQQRKIMLSAANVAAVKSAAADAIRANI